MAVAIVFTPGCSVRTGDDPLAGFRLPGRFSADARSSAEPVASAAAPADVATTRWWDSFGDSRLSALIDEAHGRNHDLAVAEAAVSAAAARARIAGAELGPAVGARFSGSRGRQNFLGFSGLLGGDDGSVPHTTVSQFGVSLDISWEVDLWGRVRAARNAAGALAEAAAADRDAAALSVAGQTAKAWFSLIAARQQHALAAAAVDSYRQSAEQVRARYERGLRSPVELRLATARLADSEALVAERERAVDVIARQLEILLGRYPAAELESPQLLPDAPEAPSPGLPTEVLRRRPDLRAAEARLFGADQGAIASSRALYPRLSLTGSAGTATNELSDVLDGDFGVWSLASGLVQPIFQGGRLIAETDRTASEAEVERQRFAATVLRALGEVETSLAAEGFLSAREQSAAAAADHYESAQKLAESRYDAGLEPYLSVLESQRGALNARSNWISTRRARLESRIDLYLALGGGFPPGGPTPDLPPEAASVVSPVVATPVEPTVPDSFESTPVPEAAR